MKKSRLNKYVIPIAIITISCIVFGINKYNEPKYEIVENTVVVTDNDIEYLESINYYPSDYFDVYFTNEEIDSGISITSDGFTTDWSTSIGNYQISFNYSTNSQNERVEIEFFTNSGSIGTVTLFDLNSIQPIALEIDQEQLSNKLNDFVTQSREIISHLSTYTFDDVLGIPINTVIQFYDYTATGKRVKQDYESCSIEYYKGKCYTKDNYLFTTKDNFNTLILEDNDYKLGYQQWISNNLLNDGTTLNESIEMEIKTDSQTETYDLTNPENLQYLTSDYQQQITMSYQELMTAYQQFIIDFNRELTV